MSAYNLLWNDNELVIEFYQPTEQQLVKVYETRMNREEAQKFAQKINRVANLKLSKKDNLMPQKPTPPTQDMEELDHLGI